MASFRLSLKKNSVRYNSPLLRRANECGGGGSTDQSVGFFFVQEQILDWQFKSSKTDSSTESELFSGLLRLNRVFQKRLVGSGWGEGGGDTTWVRNCFVT